MFFHWYYFYRHLFRWLFAGFFTNFKADANFWEGLGFVSLLSVLEQDWQ